ncbi:tyrosine recombinase XerC [Bacteroides sp. OttesenSCG-928-J23]|nr:tyrosine recombinase XerC [Bacteroides sp. OttesenSCG-928-J23]
MPPNAARFEDAPPVLRDFLFYMLTIRGRSPKTVDAYYIDLRTFLRYIRSIKDSNHLHTQFDEIPISDITIDLIRKVNLSDVYEFLNFTLSERGNNAKTRSRKVSSLRSFFKYLTTKAGLLEENIVKDLEMPSAKKSVPKYLTLEESMELMAHVDTGSSQRDYCMITLFLNCGMRLSELVGINLPDIRGNTLKLLGKGNKERIVYLNEACIYAIEQYLQVRPQPKGPDRNALFLSGRGQRLSPRRVQQIVGDCLKAAGLDGKGYSPHKLRHTAATLMYQHGNVDIRVLKEILGHANLATTEIYTHVSNKQIESAANRSPLSQVKMRKTGKKEEEPEE